MYMALEAGTIAYLNDMFGGLKPSNKMTKLYLQQILSALLNPIEGPKSGRKSLLSLQTVMLGHFRQVVEELQYSFVRVARTNDR